MISPVSSGSSSRRRPASSRARPSLPTEEPRSSTRSLVSEERREAMKIGVIGGGGLGSKYAEYLASQAETIVLHHRLEYVEKVRQHGLRMTSGDDIRIAQVTATLDPADLSGADVLLLTGKSYDTEAAV